MYYSKIRTNFNGRLGAKPTIIMEQGWRTTDPLVKIQLPT